ncbi:TPA: hypothetical protein L6A81_34875 [Pseudomonas aeruginosa]|nr:hypothetical protein [Pseudomonas aeruginosa]
MTAALGGTWTRQAALIACPLNSTCTNSALQVALSLLKSESFASKLILRDRLPCIDALLERLLMGFENSQMNASGLRLVDPSNDKQRFAQSPALTVVAASVLGRVLPFEVADRALQLVEELILASLGISYMGALLYRTGASMLIQRGLEQKIESKLPGQASINRA